MNRKADNLVSQIRHEDWRRRAARRADRYVYAVGFIGGILIIGGIIAGMDEGIIGIGALLLGASALAITNRA